jgi:NAD(P)-dependent dehydrogenase (short-subunit alcohol dehydrogenase family)
MKDIKGKTAVITGAGNGFGAEFAKEAAKRGMKLVLADIEKGEVERTLKTCEQIGAEGVALGMDVSLEENTHKLVSTAMEKYGTIDLLINNAGIGLSGRVWELPTQDWKWAIDINLLSHVFTMHEVIPIMLKQGTPCHIVNVSSVAGLVSTGNMGPYLATKHAAVLLSESTSYDLQKIKADINLSVYCPGFVQTDLNNFERHRPERYKKDDPYYRSDVYKLNRINVDRLIHTGIPIDSVGMIVFKAIEENQFYITTHPVYTKLIGDRVMGIIAAQNPDVTKLPAM